MNITYNEDGSILLTPTSEDERVAIAYELARKGTMALKRKLEDHYAQRFNQRNYETSRSLNREISTLPEEDRLAIVAIVEEEIDKRRTDGQLTAITGGLRESSLRQATDNTK